MAALLDTGAIEKLPIWGSAGRVGRWRALMQGNSVHTECTAVQLMANICCASVEVVFGQQWNYSRGPTSATAWLLHVCLDAVPPEILEGSLAQASRVLCRDAEAG